MGWPKGMTRKGHVNKDGRKHAAWGKNAEMLLSMFDKADTIKKKRGPKPKNDQWAQWKRLLVHPNGPFTVFCPNCDFPEAEGGYCPSCGWTRNVKEGKVT